MGPHSKHDWLEGHVQIGNKPKGLIRLYSAGEKTPTLLLKEQLNVEGNSFIHFPHSL